MSQIPSVLFVCLGNICRSPLAEAAFRKALADRGLEADVDSAGTGGWHVGEAPDPRAIRTAATAGIDISHYRGRQVCTADFTRFDHIVAMDADNFSTLAATSGAAGTATLSLLLDHVPGREGQSVADPYYGGESGFAATWSDVQTGANALLDHLIAAQGL